MFYNSSLPEDVTPPSDVTIGPLQRYALIAWTILCVTFAVLGNTLVLLAALRYKAIKLDRVSVILISHLAAADLCYTVVGILPTIPTLLLQRWVFGPVLCSVQYYTIYVFLLADVILVCSLNVSKLTCLLCPFSARVRSHRAGRVIALGIWTALLVLSCPLVQVCRHAMTINTGSFRYGALLNDDVIV